MYKPKKKQNQQKKTILKNKIKHEKQSINKKQKTSN